MIPSGPDPGKKARGGGILPGQRRLALAVLLAAGAVLLALGLTGGEMDFVRSTATYGNYDIPGTESWVMKLEPGVADLASIRVYGDFHLPPLIFIGVLFAVMLAVSIYRNALDLLSRKLVQWSAFALARLGVFRVSGLCPVSRTGLGVFPFLNCQACEMATGACPVGMIQYSLMELRFPALVLGALVLTGAVLGRAVCGWLCPFGFLSDAFDRASSRRFNPPTRAGYIRFLVLASLATAALWPGPLFCIFLCAGGAAFGLLPYYLTTGLPALEEMISGGGMTPIFEYHLLFGLLFLAGAVLVSGRWFCRYLCPLGAWFGLFNYVSPIKVVHDGSRCSGCGACLEACPMDVDLERGEFLDTTGCIRCGRCVVACKTGGRSFSIPAIGIPKGRKIDEGERSA